MKNDNKSQREKAVAEMEDKLKERESQSEELFNGRENEG